MNDERGIGLATVFVAIVVGVAFAVVIYVLWAPR